MQIKQQIVSPKIISERSYGYGNAKNYITIHETGNVNPGADAQAHANIQSNFNDREASWQYQVDDKEVIQSFPDDVRCWAAGSTKGNNESIHIEICVNADGDYQKALDNARELVKHLMVKHSIPLENVVTHNYWSGKICPKNLLPHFDVWKKGIEKDKFVKADRFAHESQEWVMNQGISDGSRPRDPVTRQELWVMLHRFSE